MDLGLGIAILADIAFDPARDTKLCARSAKDLFESSTCFVTMRPTAYLRPYVLDFLNIVSPTLTPAVVRDTISSARRRIDAEV